MNRKETLPKRTELKLLATTLGQRFIQRWDMYPKQLKNGQYVSIKKPLKAGHLRAHLEGQITLGTYILSPDSQGAFMVFDADDTPDWRRLQALARVLDEMACPSYLENSRRGGHLWLFFTQPRPGEDLQAFGSGLLHHFNIKDVELYPKQAKLQGGPGSLIRLPFGIHRKSGRRYGFYTPHGERLAPTLREQIQALKAPQTVPETVFERFTGYEPKVEKEPVFKPVEVAGEQVSDRIKAAISVRDFVSRYVELTPTGRGLCPFHDDRVKSFGVNEQQNYWSCFAGCGGGSVIDFYMLYQERVVGRECNFTTAVTELAEMLLV